jgi:hypothetical protein
MARVGFTSEAAANDSDTLRDLGMLSGWSLDCRLPPSPTNQHIRFMPSENGEIVSLAQNGITEFPGTTRNVYILSSWHRL